MSSVSLAIHRLEPQSARGRARLAKILDAATELFLKVGYEQASIDAILVQSGGSKSTLYAYFPTKQDLFQIGHRQRRRQQRRRRGARHQRQRARRADRVRRQSAARRALAAAPSGARPRHRRARAFSRSRGNLLGARTAKEPAAARDLSRSAEAIARFSRSMMRRRPPSFSSACCFSTGTSRCST